MTIRLSYLSLLHNPCSAGTAIERYANILNWVHSGLISTSLPLISLIMPFSPMTNSEGD